MSEVIWISLLIWLYFVVVVKLVFSWFSAHPAVKADRTVVRGSTGTCYKLDPS